MMYYYWVNHGIWPSEFLKHGYGERQIVEAFFQQEIEERKEAEKDK